MSVQSRLEAVAMQRVSVRSGEALPIIQKTVVKIGEQDYRDRLRPGAVIQIPLRNLAKAISGVIESTYHYDSVFLPLPSDLE